MLGVYGVFRKANNYLGNIMIIRDNNIVNRLLKTFKVLHKSTSGIVFDWSCAEKNTLESKGINN